MEKLKIEYIEANLLIPNKWNSNQMSKENERKLEESLRRNSLFDAIIARDKGDGTFEILGGEHRAKIAKKIGMDKIPTIVLHGISDDRAKEISLSHNSRYGSDDNLKLSELINSLESPDALSDILPYSEIEIEALMSASKIDLDTLDILDDDIDLDEELPKSKSSKTHTIMRFKVSVEDAEEIEGMIKETIRINGFTGSDALTNAGDALVHLLMNEKDV